MDSLTPSDSFRRTHDALARSKLSKERTALQLEQKDLLRRRDLAYRRLAAHQASLMPDTSNTPQQASLAKPAEIIRLRDLLANPTDEALAQIAAEVRDLKHDLTEKVVRFYADRCDRDGFLTLASQ